MSQTQRRYVVRFVGHVQGVCFRATCLAEAAGLQINGFVRNEMDGSVLMDVDGTPADLRELLARVKSRMEQNIHEVVLDERESKGRTEGFHIAY